MNRISLLVEICTSKEMKLTSHNMVVAYSCFDFEKVGARSLLVPVKLCNHYQGTLRTQSTAVIHTFVHVNSGVVEDFEVKGSTSLRLRWIIRTPVCESLRITDRPG